MAYEFYCTRCGRKLNQDIVLFDMHRVLIEDKNTEFNVLKFRLTQKQLQDLIRGGTAEPDGYRKCTLTLSQVMGFMANKYNLRDPMIGGLTMEQINKYTEEPILAKAPVTSTGVFGGGLSWDDDDDEEDEDAEDAAPAEEAEEETKEEEVLPPALKALEDKVTAMVADDTAKELLKKDLEILKDCFEKGSYWVLLKEFNEEYDGGQKLCIGYEITYPVSGTNAIERCRVCPGNPDRPEAQCGAPVFEHAGTAKHRTVVFIGNPASGKTSTILALTHYALNHMTHGTLTDIWSQAKTVDSVKNIELVGVNAELKKHLEQYSQGIAPERTPDDDRKKAYCATFWIKSENEKHYLLTLTDLPGEICNKNGSNEVAEDRVINDFQAALGCDAFVACFDTADSIAAGQDDAIKINGQNPSDIINSICKQVNTFQSLRITRGRDQHYIPVMLLFTKCADLENQKKTDLGAANDQPPLERVYMFRGEQETISGNGIYNAVCKTFANYGDLTKAYHAMLRCSPFGYAAPTDFDIRQHGKEYHLPEPKHIDALMRWLLMVSGCVPVEGLYCPNLTFDGSGLKNRNYYLKDVQYRAKHPEDGWDGQEAVARAYLFENMGQIDKMVLEDYGANRWVVRLHQATSANKRNDAI